VRVVDEEIQQKAGDYLFDQDHMRQLVGSKEEHLNAQYVKFIITENYGGSGVHISKLYVFGTPVEGEQ